MQGILDNAYDQMEGLVLTRRALCQARMAIHRAKIATPANDAMRVDLAAIDGAIRLATDATSRLIKLDAYWDARG